MSISDYAYHPASITVAPGAKVTFTNHDQTAHTATSQRRGFDTGTINPGHSATVTLDTPGTYTYYCQFHPFMHGTIIVVRRPGTSLYLAARVRLRDRQGPRGLEQHGRTSGYVSVVWAAPSNR